MRPPVREATGSVRGAASRRSRRVCPASGRRIGSASALASRSGEGSATSANLHPPYPPLPSGTGAGAEMAPKAGICSCFPAGQLRALAGLRLSPSFPHPSSSPPGDPGRLRGLDTGCSAGVTPPTTTGTPPGTLGNAPSAQSLEHEMGRARISSDYASFWRNDAPTERFIDRGTSEPHQPWVNLG